MVINVLIDIRQSFNDIRLQRSLLAIIKAILHRLGRMHDVKQNATELLAKVEYILRSFKYVRVTRV